MKSIYIYLKRKFHKLHVVFFFLENDLPMVYEHIPRQIFFFFVFTLVKLDFFFEKF